MVARGFREGWNTSSVFVKLGIIALGVIILAVIIVATKGWIQNRSYERKEAQRAEERQQMEQEKAQLQVEKQRALTEAADANARADTYKQVAESKRADKAQTVKELEQIERDHAQHKQEAEAAGSALSDDELRRELCARLAARGYPPCPN